MSSKVYTTALSPEEIRRRLQPHVLSLGAQLKQTMSFPPPGRIVAKVRGHRFRLYAHGHKFIQNSFAPFFFDRIEAHCGASRIRGRLGMHPFVRLFMTIWFGGVVIGAVLFPAFGLAGRFKAGKPPLIVLLAPLLLLVFGVALILIGHRLGRGPARPP